MPRPWMATAIRASFMKVRSSEKRAPRGPSSSAQLPSKLSSQVAEPRMTIFFSGLATRKLSRPFSIRGATSRERPSRPLDPGSVRASTTETSPQPLVMNCLRPVMRQCPPSGTAVAATLPTSEPASGPVMAPARGGWMDDLAGAEADALLVDLARVGRDLTRRVLADLAQRLVVDLARLAQGARAVLEPEALFPERHEALPGHALSEVELEVVVVGEEVQVSRTSCPPGHDRRAGARA